MGDFDFLFGTWRVRNVRLKERLVGCTEWEEFISSAWCRGLFDGQANIDEIEFPDGTRGLTLRLFDPAARQWSLYWSSSQTGRLFPPVVGAFAGDRGEFFGDDTEAGTPVRVRFIWSDITPTSARWEQAFSVDGGDTWEINWIMEMTRSTPEIK
jgi:hypothetical protein